MNGFTVKNFRIFDNSGVKVEFSPVTILTGANSSGKSSYVKALVLFSQWMDEVRNEYKRSGNFNPAQFPLDFSKSGLKLNGYKNSINRNCAQDEMIIFSLDIDMNVLGEYTVDFAFSPSKDMADSGELASIMIFFKGEEIFVAKRKRNELRKVLFKGMVDAFIKMLALVFIPKDLLGKSPSGRLCENAKINECMDKDGKIDWEKLYLTKEALVIKEVQSAFDLCGEKPDLSAIMSRLPYYVNLQEKLFSQIQEIYDSLDKTIETKIFFYFPVLDKFKGLNKDESINLLESEAHLGNTQSKYDYMGVFHNDYSFAERLKRVINAYRESEYESFIDFYKMLESNFFASGEKLPSLKNRFLDINNVIQYFDLDEVFEPYEKDCCSQNIFSQVYNVLSAWQWAIDEDGRDYYDGNSKYIIREVCQEPYDFYYTTSKHKLNELYKETVNYMLMSLLLPEDFANIHYFNGSFTNVQRLHSFEDNSPIVRNICEFDEAKRVKSIIDNKCVGQVSGTYPSSGISNYTPGEFINKWLGKLKIGDKLVIDREEEGFGFKLFIKKGNVKESLADLGHGVTQTISLLILLETSIIKSLIYYYYCMSYGYNSEAYTKATYVIVEEPEVSMHPKYQSMLADMFHEAATVYGKNLYLIVETHSEYMVRKTQNIVSDLSDEAYKSNPFAVYYFEEDGSAYSLGYTRSGRFERPFGTGFFDESARLNYHLMLKEQEL